MLYGVFPSILFGPVMWSLGVALALLAFILPTVRLLYVSVHPSGSKLPLDNLDNVVTLRHAHIGDSELNPSSYRNSSLVGLLGHP